MALQGISGGESLVSRGKKFKTVGYHYCNTTHHDTSSAPQVMSYLVDNDSTLKFGLQTTVLRDRGNRVCSLYYLVK